METNTPYICQDCPACQGSSLEAEPEARMISTLRHLQRDRRSCPVCAEAEACPLLANFKSTVMQAVQVVGERWNLVSYAANPPADQVVAERTQLGSDSDPAWELGGGGR